ncbi:hypothetical protein U9M48_034665 [Paspalum notatum var. saurae]|uniref:Uncharacterized protein n=1 Tax=Paspalum notatum var. saurae TaxID=547442 RepID=A0AAQ3UAX0_PASNO
MARTIYRSRRQPCYADADGSAASLLTTLLCSTSFKYTDDDDPAVYIRSSLSYTNPHMLMVYCLYYDNLHAPFDTDEADDVGLHRLMDTDEAMDDADMPTPTPTPTPSHARRSEAKD